MSELTVSPHILSYQTPTMSIPVSARAFRSPRSLVQSGKVTVPSVFEWNALENPDHPVFVFHDGQGLNTITFSQCAQAMRRAARYLNARIPTPECIAVLATTGGLQVLNSNRQAVTNHQL